MSWLLTSNHLPRVPEPEIMDDAGEVEAYSSAAAQACLGKIDDTLVDHAVRLLSLPSARSGSSPSPATRRNAIADRAGWLLDVGTGPGQIALKLARRLPGWHLVGIDRSPNMIRQGVAASRLQLPSLQNQNMRDPDVSFLVSDAGCLPFRDASFDLVLCNSVVHHLEKPALLLAEIARVAKPDGAILVRDLRRPSRLAYPLHVRWYGRHYSGLMYKLYCDSVRAAYTADELAAMLRTVPLPGARIFTHGCTHLGFERAAG
jgi:ubiquinone/menaquinone biosynthesis C-methylase UbiE